MESLVYNRRRSESAGETLGISKLMVIVAAVLALSSCSFLYASVAVAHSQPSSSVPDSFDGWLQDELRAYKPLSGSSEEENRQPQLFTQPGYHGHIEDDDAGEAKQQQQQQQQKKKKRRGRALAAASNFSGNVIVVAQDGSGNFRRVQAAINSLPVLNTKPVTIFVKRGVYNEKITVPSGKRFITLKGESAAATFLQWSDTAYVLAKDGKPLGTYASASVAVEADDFVAIGIAFKNTARHPPAGAVNRQAVALRVQGDRAAFYNCSFYGAQGTLYDKEGRHYYYNCYIEGAIDTIFGDARSLFLNCRIHSIATTYGSISAENRMTATSNTGYSFVSCVVSGTGIIYLGRAWGPYSRIVFANTVLANIIRPEGWDDFGVPSNQKTVFFGEYNCKGPGANRKGRVAWSRSLTYLQAKPFLSVSFIDGQQWLPKL